jgi:hypothetical protein
LRQSAPKVFITSTRAAVHPAAFYLGIPAGLALLYALLKAGLIAQYFPFPLSWTYWFALLMPRWLLQDLATQVVRAAARRFHPPLWIVLTIGGFIGSLLLQPYALWLMSWFQEAFQAHIPIERRLPIEWSWTSTVTRIHGTFPQHIAAIAVWVVANLILERGFGFDRFAYGSESILDSPATSPVGTVKTEKTEPPTGNFRARLRRIAHDEIIALKAEDHYVRVISATQAELVLYRFADAVREMGDADGLRVHRSFWVARKAVRRSHDAGPGLQLELVNGNRIPVGRSYRELVRQAGLTMA